MSPRRYFLRRSRDRDSERARGLFTGFFSCWFSTQLAVEMVSQVVLLDERPPIPDDLNPELAKLLSDCWATDQKARPSFLTIWRRLASMEVPGQSFERSSGIFHAHSCCGFPVWQALHSKTRLCRSGQKWLWTLRMTVSTTAEYR